LQPTIARQFPELVVHDPLDVDFYAAASVQKEVILIVMDRLNREP
jgi:hypothetical protein